MLGNPSDQWIRHEVALPPHTLLVQVSEQLRDQLRVWSEPVQLRVVEHENGSHEMVVRPAERDGGAPLR